MHEERIKTIKNIIDNIDKCKEMKFLFCPECISRLEKDRKDFKAMLDHYQKEAWNVSIFFRINNQR